MESAKQLARPHKHRPLTLCYSCKNANLFTLNTPRRLVQGIWPQGYKTYLMVNSTEYQIFPTYKC